MKPNQWLEKADPHLNELWRGRWRAGTLEPGRYLYDHELVVVSEGSCRVQIGAKFHELTTGSFLIVPPGHYHVTTTGRSGVYRFCIHFDWEAYRTGNSRRQSWVYHPNRPDAGKIKKAPAFVPHLPAGSFNLSGFILPLLETLFHNWQTGHELDRAICRPVFTQILLHLLWRKSRRAPLLDRGGRLAYATKELLDKSPESDVSVQTLLSSLGFSYAHLGRLFKSKFGISPLRYRNAVRLERAKHLLQDPKRSVASAAYEVGFKDPAYFSRRFHQSQGLSPRQAR